MLSKEAIKDLKKDCTFEEINRIEAGIESINSWKTFSKNQVKNMIDNEIFSKYTVNV